MAPPPPGVPTGSGVGELQRFLKDFLDLDYQLDGIDYTRPNFVHADLDTETFEKLQAQRGESFATLMLQQLLNAMTNPPQSASQDDSVTQLIQVLTRPDAERQMKLMIARQMQDIESVAAGLEGPRGSVILTERNKAAIAVLQRELKAGKRNMVLFYGAAHMGDLSRRVESLGFSPVSTQWHLAWNLMIRPDQPSAIEKLLRELAQPEPQPAPSAARP
jgi:hypothetical protein